MDEHEIDEPRKQRSDDRILRPLPRWKRNLLGISLVLTVAGLALMAYGRTLRQATPDQTPAPQVTPAPDPGTTSAAIPDAQRRGFVSPGQAPSAGSGTTAAPTPDTSASSDSHPAASLEQWSPAIFRLGFSFFVGFCIGYALRVFFKLGIFLLGLTFLALAGLQYAGLINIDWFGLQGHYDQAVEWTRARWPEIQRILTGYLPAAGSGVFGLLVGFKR